MVSCQIVDTDFEKLSILIKMVVAKNEKAQTGPDCLLLSP